MEKTNYIQIQWTAAHLDEAREILENLLERKLIACGSILPQVESIYCWEGEIVSEREVKVLCKTIKRNFSLVESVIKESHSYDIVEILSFQVDEGNKSYLNWLNEQFIN